MTTGRLTVVGLGPGDAALVTDQVRASIAAATDAFGYFPYVERLAGMDHLRLHASDNREELGRARQALDLAASGRQVLMLSSGDPGVFAMASAVFEVLDMATPEQRQRWAAVDIEVQPGITAMLAAAARLGAPLGHDFCTINLSDNLKPAAVIERRIRLAAQADFAMAFYNPCSRSRPEGFARALRVLQQECEPGRLVCFARNVSRADETLDVLPLAQVQADMADMRTVVIVGSSLTRRVGRHVYTPRSYPDA
ncbi:precorrin-3B C(17)-methyltransferase [Comamonas endophytica]|uniref:Precorrin-3B C(17)-methyltransferase n=1 Tax=Comamonas endophytica TaxID=2949090 RepID=A0ABY6G713_9BURK|nr:MULTISPECIES: precorrin-3B C(17)-methyltransferase [unclassified Acidovorax]MCD2511442.1 precorrin-3B C(17)-methyltransferase [Acidovorax sp. D4N7]UYG50833.1 precorrin-3B C(17)-methyltransferase [Acidovorax sp. 5MLIR]